MNEPRILRRDGLDIAYRVSGEGAPLLLLMGLGGRSSDWGEHFVSALAQSYRVITVDNRGTGASSAPPRGTVPSWTLRDFAADAVAVLDAEGVARAHVLGLSMGGMIAQTLALDHPSRVDRLILLSTHAGGPVQPRDPAVLAAFMPAKGTPMSEVMRGALRLITAPGYADAQPEAIEALVQAAEGAPTPKAVFGAQLQAIFTDDRRARLGAVQAPTLVIHGVEDPLIPVENGRELGELIPGARLCELPGVGHMPMWEAADATVAAIRGHLS